MIMIDQALKAREAEGNPIRVGLIGAGFMGQGLTNQIVNSTPGMRMVAVQNRHVQRARDVLHYSGLGDVLEATTQDQLEAFKTQVCSRRYVEPALKSVLEKIPKSAHPMDVMRCICSFMGVLSPESQENQAQDIAIRLMASYGPALCYWLHFSQSGLRIETDKHTKDSIALNFLKLLRQQEEIPALDTRTLDVSLILYAEHDFNASTFASRVTAST